MAYVELHAHSHYSLLDGASSPAMLVQRAAELGMTALALTDHDNLYGAVEFSQAARAHGIRPIFGAELTVLANDGAIEHLTLLVQDVQGWANLCQLITIGQHNAPKGQSRLPAAALQGHTAGLIALTGCRRGAMTAALLRQDEAAALAAAKRYRELFGAANLYVELQHHLLPEDDWLIDAQVALARRLALGCVATNNVHYAHRDGQPLQDVLVCIRERVMLEAAGGRLRPNDEYHLKDHAALAPLFRRYPEALAQSSEIAARCTFTLAESLQPLPRYPTPPGQSAADHLRWLCLNSPRCTGDALRRQVDHELAVIIQAGLENYFLVVWDIVRYAREQGIRCQGRGSAANSVVAYLLHITPVNPLAHDLVFERFLSNERRAVPDIDLDFDNSRREEVIQYVYERYGRAHAAMACTFITFRARSAVRDVGKVLGLSDAMVDHLAKSLDVHDVKDLQASAPTAALLLDLCRQIDHLPRHLSIHNGGMVIAADPLAARLPTEPAAMPGRTVVQWDKDSLEDAGIVKIDLLALGMLALLDEAALLADADLDTLRFDDPAVYDMIGQADTVGVFQIESRAQMQVLPRMKPRSFNDLVVSISLIRPGPLQGDMVHPYLRRRLEEEPISYDHPDLEPALAETLGVILFQEQVLKVARDLAGFTAGQGELLRRALGRKHALEAIQAFEQAFINGAVGRGVPPDVAQRVFNRLLGFGSYSFPKSHAVSFAVLVYQSAWLRRYHPIPFYIALLNNQPMGFYSPAVIVNDARRQGLKVRRVDVNQSADRCTPLPDGFRLGLNMVRGMGQALAGRLLDLRQSGPFGDLADFCRRTKLPARIVENLIQAGAMDGWGLPRRDLIWALGALHIEDDALDLPGDATSVVLPTLSPFGRMNMEQRAVGLTTGPHLMALLRPDLHAQGLLDSADLEHLPHGQVVRVAGLVVVRQAPPTAKGFRFLTLEDEHGFINVIVKPRVYEAHRLVIRGQRVLVIDGLVQRERAVLNVVARSLHPLQG